MVPVLDSVRTGANGGAIIGLDASSLFTLSGLLFIGAAAAYAAERPIVAAALLIMAGAGGSAVAWERWSARTGEQVHLTAFFSPVAPSAAELTMLATHVPMLIIGLALLAVSVRRRDK